MRAFLDRLERQPQQPGPQVMDQQVVKINSGGMADEDNPFRNLNEVIVFPPLQEEEQEQETEHHGVNIGEEDEMDVLSSTGISSDRSSVTHPDYMIAMAEEGQEYKADTATTTKLSSCKTSKAINMVMIILVWMFLLFILRVFIG